MVYVVYIVIMVGLGQVAPFFGIEVAKSTDGIGLSQKKYVLDIGGYWFVGSLGSGPLDTPMDPNAKFCVDEEVLVFNLD